VVHGQGGLPALCSSLSDFVLLKFNLFQTMVPKCGNLISLFSSATSCIVYLTVLSGFTEYGVVSRSSESCRATFQRAVLFPIDPTDVSCRRCVVEVSSGLRASVFVSGRKLAWYLIATVVLASPCWRVDSSALRYGAFMNY